jgi:hypothetical protein
MVERCFSKLKHSRRLATRYDKTADSYTSFILIALPDCGSDTSSTEPRGPTSELGQKRKWRRFQVMSALPHKADINARDCDVRFVPKETHAPRQTAPLFNHLVGTGEQCWGDIEPKRLRTFEVDDQLELCGLLDG